MPQKLNFFKYILLKWYIEKGPDIIRDKSHTYIHWENVDIVKNCDHSKGMLSHIAILILFLILKMFQNSHIDSQKFSKFSYWCCLGLKSHACTRKKTETLYYYKIIFDYNEFQLFQLTTSNFPKFLFHV
jgi:hypothetical protein